MEVHNLEGPARPGPLNSLTLILYARPSPSANRSTPIRFGPRRPLHCRPRRRRRRRPPPRPRSGDSSVVNTLSSSSSSFSFSRCTYTTANACRVYLLYVGGLQNPTYFLGHTHVELLLASSFHSIFLNRFALVLQLICIRWNGCQIKGIYSDRC